MAEDTVNINPWGTEIETPLFTEETAKAYPISSDAADRLSFMAHYGLANVLKKSKEEIFQGLTYGGEANMREQAAHEITRRKGAAGEKVLAEIAKSRPGGMLNNEDFDFVRRTIDEMNEQTSPETVFEQAYAKEYMGALDRAGVRIGSDLSSAGALAPNSHAKNLELGSDLGAKTGWLDTLRHRVQEMYDSQSWPGWFLDQGKMIFPGYGPAKLTGRTSETGLSLLVGNNVEEQSVEMYKMKLPDFQKKTEKEVMDIAKDNPYAALTYIDALKGQSSNEKVLNNLFPVIDVATLPVGYVGGKVAKGISRAQDAIATSRGATQTYLRELSKTPPSPSSIASAAGDLDEAAKLRATAEVAAQQKGMSDPTRAMREQLPTTLQTDLADMSASPGRFGQDNVNKFIERTDNLTNKLFAKLFETLRVNRLPEMISSETTVRAVMDHIKDTYGGLRNRVLDITRPEHEPYTNTWFSKMIIGDGGGIYFPTRQAAERFAKDNGLVDVTYGSKAGAPTTAPQQISPQEIEKMSKRLKSLEEFAAENPEDLKSVLEFRKQNLDDLRKEYYEKIRTASNQKKIEYRSEWEAKAKVIQKDVRELEGYFKALEGPKTTVKQQGAGWYIEKIVPIDETTPAIRNAIKKEVETANSKVYTPRSFLNDWVGRFRTPEETMSEAARENRKIATYSVSVFRDIVKESLAEIQQLKGYWPKQKWKDWQRVIKAGQDMVDEQGQPGAFFKSPGDLEHYYQTHIGRLPDEQETRAYFAFKRTMEYDRMFRNLAVHRNMLRLGAEEHTFFTMADGVRLAGPKFAGVRMNHIPGGEGTILIIGDELGTESTHALSPAFRKKWEDAVASGEYKVIEVHDPERRVFSGFGEKIGNARVQYVMAKNTETKALDINHIPRRGGGHVEYEYDQYLKQAKVRWDETGKKHWYEGDVTVLAVPIPKIGEEVLVHLNKVRELMHKANTATDELGKSAAETEAMMYAKEHMEINWNELRGWFKAQKDENGVVKPPRLDTREPIYMVKKDKNILQMDGDALLERYGADSNNFRDGTKSGSLARQFSVQFTEQRDADKLLAATVEGTEHNPLYKLTAAETIDPISTMNRALNRIITTNFFDDYKIFSVEHWLAEAAPHLDAKKEILMHSPFWHFNNALTMFRVGADKSTVARLKGQHMQIQQLLGIPSEVDSFIEAASQKLSDALYEKTGKTFVVSPKRDLPILTDPVQFTRSIVFHTNIGLFNIPQFIVQSMNYVNMAAIAPRNALAGSYAAQLHFWSRVNSHPNIINKLDEYASKLRVPGLTRWKPGEFKEAMEVLAETGFGNVGREYAILDDVMREKFITSNGRTFLDAGTIFFKAGERNARYGAWYTAFKEFRDANPFKKLTQADKAAILDRADLLNMNMSRASNSTLHQGIWSIPTQFLTYQLRVAELFFGKRLGNTVQERMLARARLVGANAFMFGIPTAAGVTALPFTDALRTYALENGYVVGENFLSSLAMEGIPSAITAMITGQGDFSKGTWYNYGDRYGTKGFETINNLMRSDKTFWDIFGGAAYSKLSSTWQQTDGLRAAMMSILRDEDKHFPLKIEDFMDVFKEISSVNSAWRMIGAINTGRWMSKHEGYITDTSPANAIFSTLTGLQEQNTSDVYRLSNSLKSQQSLEKHVEKQFIQEFRRFAKNTEDGNHSEGQRNLIRARAFLKIGGYPEDKYKQLIRMAVQDNKSLVDRIDFSFYLKNAPAGTKDVLKEAYRTKLNMRNPENN